MSNFNLSLVEWSQVEGRMYAVTLLQKGVARAEALERASRYAKHLLLPDAAAEAFWNGAYDLYEEGVS